MKKISFLIAAHNEESIIQNALHNLEKLPYDNYEVIVGLDGCTDNTEKIVQEFSKRLENFRYYKLNLRKGKPAVIDEIIKKSRGEIIIINDADWIFYVKSRSKLKEFISIFDDKRIGGIAESFPVEWSTELIKSGSIAFKMSAYSSYFWMKFQKEKLTKGRKDILFVKDHRMFMTNVFRKNLYYRNTSLGDDFERTYDIRSKGYDVILFDDIDFPRMIVSYNKVSIKDLFRQKIRTAIGRRQLSQSKKLLNNKEYYLKSSIYILRESWRYSLRSGFLVSLWFLLMFFATIKSKFVKLDTEKGWSLRIKR